MVTLGERGTARVFIRTATGTQRKCVFVYVVITREVETQRGFRFRKPRCEWASLGRHVGDVTYASPRFCLSHACMNASRSPSSTAWVLPVSTSVRRSFTIW